VILSARRLAGRVSVAAVDAVRVVLSADEVGYCLTVLGSIRRLSIVTYAAVVEGSLHPVSD
jgi:hypothetical protein